MGSNWTFGWKVGLGYGIGALILLIVAIAGYEGARRLIENDGWVEHTQQTRRETTELISALENAETGQRGFVITGDESYLAPYNAALPDIETIFSDLRHLTGDNLAQQQRLDQLRPIIDLKLAELARTIQQRRTEGFAATQHTIMDNAGKNWMDQMRHILADMAQEEATLLDSRRLAAEAAANGAKLVILGGGIAGVLFSILVGWIIISSLTKQIGSVVQHVQSSSSELQAAANQQVTGAREQAASMNEITTTISELLATSRQIAESAQRVSRIAGENASLARTGEQTVGSTHEAIQVIKRQVDLIVAHMLELGKKSQQIGGILEIINELAEQTNILAINATIEAAGAGETGRRFSVVADEIRKLADRVGGSTKEIRSLIDEIRAAVNTTVMTTEGGTKAVEAGAQQFVGVTTQFRQITSLMQTTTDAAREIELSTKQQATAVEQVNLAVANVAQASRENESSSAQTLQTASELTKLSRELLRIVTPQTSA